MNSSKSVAHYDNAGESALTRLGNIVRKLGVVPGLRYAIGKRQQRATGSLWSLHPRRVLHPLQLRAGTSDIEVFYQIFVEQEYAVMDDFRDVGLIIDGGANVGYSAAYFLSTFASCEVIAIEPDPENAQMLRRNMAPYGERVRCLERGLWSHNARLKMADSSFRDGAHWARQVRECAADEPGGLDSVGIGELLRESGHARISVLKLDIEGAETVLFSRGYEDWIDRVDTFVIELHNDSPWGNASEAFDTAIAGRGLVLSRSGELTIAHRATAQA